MASKKKKLIEITNNKIYVEILQEILFNIFFFIFLINLRKGEKRMQKVIICFLNIIFFSWFVVFFIFIVTLSYIFVCEACTHISYICCIIEKYHFN